MAGQRHQHRRRCRRQPPPFFAAGATALHAARCARLSAGQPPSMGRQPGGRQQHRLRACPAPAGVPRQRGPERRICERWRRRQRHARRHARVLLPKRGLCAAVRPADLPCALLLWPIRRCGGGRGAVGGDALHDDVFQHHGAGLKTKQVFGESLTQPFLHVCLSPSMLPVPRSLLRPAGRAVLHVRRQAGLRRHAGPAGRRHARGRRDLRPERPVPTVRARVAEAAPCLRCDSALFQ